MGKWLAIIGSSFLLALPVGLIVTIISMVEGYNTIVAEGSGDPKLMAGIISTSLVTSIIGLIFTLPGALLLCISILVFKYRVKWVYYVSLLASILVLLMLPIGTIISLALLSILILKRSQFQNMGI